MSSFHMEQAERIKGNTSKPLEGKELRSVHSEEKADAAIPKWPKVISVSSGKGGVGKTNVVANLAYAFTQLQKKVVVLDADLGLANIDILLGLTSQHTIEHFLRHEKSIVDILIQGPGGMSIMPASSGVLELVNLNESQKIFLLNELDFLAATVDILLIDTAAGISSNVLYFNLAAEEAIVIITPEPTSINNAYTLIKVLSNKYKKKNFTLLINSARNSQEAREVYKKISLEVDRCLDSLSIDYLGFIPFDEKLPDAVKQRRPVLEIYPHAISSRSFMKIAKILVAKPPRNEMNGGIQFFWKYLLRHHQLIEKNGGTN